MEVHVVINVNNNYWYWQVAPRRQGWNSQHMHAHNKWNSNKNWDHDQTPNTFVEWGGSATVTIDQIKERPPVCNTVQ